MNPKNQKGFTLIEMLVSIAVFMLVMLAVYAFFDQGQWLYLHSENRSNIQDMARLAAEQMERDFRMIGANVPTATAFGGATKFSPLVIYAAPNKIGFFSDINSGNTRLAQNAASGATTLIVENAPSACSSGTLAVISKDMRQWGPITCTASDATTLTVSAIGAAVSSTEGMITTPERIWYRLNGDADNNGVCDTTTPPFCTLEKAELATNTADTTEPTDSDYVTIATNIKSLNLTYTTMNGVSLGTTPTGGSLFALSRIGINLVATDYGVGGTNPDGSFSPSGTQDINIVTEAMIRDMRY